jgi:hypothetical protein
MNFIFGLIMLGALGIFARRGAFAAATTFAMTFIAAMAAFNYYPLVQWGVVWLYKPLGPYADALGLFIAFIAIFTGLQYGAMAIVGETIDLNPVINAVAGAAFGGLTGLFLIGILSITWFMMPGSAYFVDYSDEHAQPKVLLNADEAVLSSVRFIANERLSGSASFDPTNAFMRSNSYKFTNPAVTGNARVEESPAGEEPKADINAVRKNRAEMERERQDAN